MRASSPVAHSVPCIHVSVCSDCTSGLRSLAGSVCVATGRRCAFIKDVGNCVLLAKVINEFVSGTRQLDVIECLLGNVISVVQPSSTVSRATWQMNSRVAR